MLLARKPKGRDREVNGFSTDLLAVMDLQMAVEKQLGPRHIKTLLEGVAIATGGLRQFGCDSSEPAVVMVCGVFGACRILGLEPSLTGSTPAPVSTTPPLTGMEADASSGGGS